MHLDGLNSQRSHFLLLAISMMTCLILLINVSFKIISCSGLVIATNSLLCPLIAWIYLIALRHCSFNEQRHVLNIALMSLYSFCMGVFLLVNLPPSDYMNGNPVYQIVFQDIPRKFFATTIAFAFSFYLPHFMLCNKTYNVLTSPRRCVLLAGFGGLAFFCIDFYLLFSELFPNSFTHIFIDSTMIATLILLVIAVIYLTLMLYVKSKLRRSVRWHQKRVGLPVYEYFLCMAVSVMFICLACEYQLVAFGKEGILAASALFFPLTLMVSTIVGEIWGYYANLKLTAVLILTQFIFDTILMFLVALPSPALYDLNPFYNHIIPQRLPAATLALFASFMCHSLLLHYLRNPKLDISRAWRIMIASICANSLLCLIDYSLLYGGIYPYEEVVNLGVYVWQYKLFASFLLLPLVLWLCRRMERVPGIALSTALRT